MFNLETFKASASLFVASAKVAGVAPRVFFTTTATGDELVADAALVAAVDEILAGLGAVRDTAKGAFAPGGFAGIRAPADENTPRVAGEGCLFLKWEDAYVQLSDGSVTTV
jgi:hypothetical protein